MGDDQHRIDALEARVAALEAQLAATRPAAPVGPPSPQQPPPPRPVGAPPAVGREPRVPPVSIDSETALKWGGVGLVVLALAFAVSTAIRRGWIGPELQLLGAVAISLALIGTGIRLLPDRPAWTHALCSGGVAGLLVTFASDLFLDQADEAIAYGLVVFVGVAAIALARMIASEWVALVALGGGAVAWLTIADGDAPFVESGAVLVVAIIVTVATSVERDWIPLRLLAQGIGLASTLAFAIATDDAVKEVGATLAVAALVALALLTTPSLGPRTGRWATIESQLPTALAPWVLAVLAILFVDDDTAAGWIALAVAVVVIAVALVLRRRLLDPHVVALLVGASVTITIGLGILLATELAWTAVAVQGVGLVILSRRLPDSTLMKLNAAALLIGAATFVLSDGSEAWRVDAALSADLARLATIAAIATGIWASGFREARRLGAVAVLGLTLLWCGSVLVHLPQGQALTSLAWAVIGVGILAAGAVRRMHDVGQVGLAVLAITVVKLLVVDLEAVDALWRAGLFLVIGLTFLRLGFLLPRWTHTAGESPEAIPAEP